MMDHGPTPAARWRDVDGILLLDKPEGLTSNAALQRARRAYRARKAGHTGSLDPLASGLLPVCFGQATKASALLLDADKTYAVTIALGERTATADREGEVVERADVPALTEAFVRQQAARFLGESSRCRRCIRPSSMRASGCTGWRARASRSSGRRAASSSGGSNCWRWAPGASNSRWIAARELMSGRWPKTLPAPAARSGTCWRCGD